MPRIVDKESLKRFDLDLVLTARRAATLKARVYDGDLSRVALPGDAGLDWVRSIADPADDLAMPMKGPLQERRGGDVALHRLAIEPAPA